MALSDRKITTSDITSKGVVAAPDTMTGTAAENKQVFDRLIREVVKDDLNGVIDDLMDESAAGVLGFDPPSDMEATNIQDAIEEIKDDAEAGSAKAEAQALKSEGYAVGKQNGTDVGSTSPYYHNNSKYYSEQAASSATNAATSASNASTAETNAGTYASNAANSASSASGSEGRASTYASNAATSASTAETHKNSAATSAETATTKAQAAAGSATNAAGYAENANTYRQQAAASAQEAAESAGSVQYPVSYGVAQTLTDAQKLQARNNISAGSQADISSLNTNKADKVSSVTTGDLASLTSAGDLADSGYKGAYFGDLGNAIGMRGWNQLQNKELYPSSDSSEGITYTNNDDGSFTINGTTTNDNWYFNLDYVIGVNRLTNGHKYFFAKGCDSPYYIGVRLYTSSGEVAIVADQLGDQIFTANIASSNITSWTRIQVQNDIAFSNVRIYPQLIDLTALFGAGNEPSTVAEFRAMFPADYYPYCSGSFGDLLWTNASPSSDFAAQTVSVDLSGYSHCYIVFNIAPSVSTKKVSLLLPVDSFGAASSLCDTEVTSSSVISGDFRTATINASSIVFGSGYYAYPTQKTVGDAFMIPYKIYGVR